MLKTFYIKKQFFIQSRSDIIKDHYEIQEIIGRGAFATVYKAKMKYYPYTVRAVKRIKKKFIKDPASILTEYAVLSTFDHPQIIKIYETFEDNQNFFMVLDYCDGGELFTRLEKEGNFTETDARVLFTQMISVIKYCHSHQVAHRDLKPQNFLMVSKQSLDIMLIDFGLSYRWKKDMRQEVRKKDGKGQPIGTAYYMAPQIFTGSYDQRCDIWSLGIVLFMLVTGEPPVSGSSSQQILNNIREGKFNFNVLKQKELNPRLVDLILKILVNQRQRISIDDILNHSWMTMKLVDRKLNINFEKIRKYSKLSKFKILVLNYIASQLPQRDIMVLGKVFMDIDENKDGYLSIEEMANYMKEEPAKPQYEDICNIIKYMDVDFNGKLAYNQFISACLSKSSANNREYLRNAFHYFDLNHDNKISKEELSIVLKAYRKEYSQNQKLIDKLLQECDTNQDGEIDFEQFCLYLIDKNVETADA